MHPAQQFVHGDDLKADLKNLDELYLQLPKETLEKGLYSFAPAPPDDSRYLEEHGGGTRGDQKGAE